ncbi:hypothetical protein [Brevibacillus brevis]|uniref:hypothetical protein n=1 Tax=Brevibacillus brevis TaxID=1393 RepID=UPI0025A51996|nr:hypothetical protein [Brevibacillus brevis]WJQ84346.1 hypothetical protein QN310_14870 [Brevibacillus brevis]
MVELHNITITTKKDDRTLIQNLHLTLQTGEKIAIIWGRGKWKKQLIKIDIRGPNDRRVLHI